MAKHGNRSVSSRCGSADVLEALGVPLDLEPERLGALLDAHGFAFLFAPRLHPAMKAVMPVRRGARGAHGVQPARPALQPGGCLPPGGRRLSNRAAQALVAGALAELGAEHAWVVHSDDGLDELSVCAPTRVIEVRAGAVTGELTVDPAALGIAGAERAALAGGDAAESARRLRAILGRQERSAASEAVALNAGAALLVAGLADDLPFGLAAARECLALGEAAALLDRVVAAARGEAA